MATPRATKTGMPTPIPAPSPAFADALSPLSATEDPAAFCGVATGIAEDVVITGALMDVRDVDVEIEEVVVVDVEAEVVVVELEVMLK